MSCEGIWCAKLIIEKRNWTHQLKFWSYVTLKKVREFESKLKKEEKQNVHNKLKKDIILSNIPWKSVKMLKALAFDWQMLGIEG